MEKKVPRGSTSTSKVPAGTSPPPKASATAKSKAAEAAKPDANKEKENSEKKRPLDADDPSSSKKRKLEDADVPRQKTTVIDIDSSNDEKNEAGLQSGKESEHVAQKVEQKTRSHLSSPKKSKSLPVKPNRVNEKAKKESVTLAPKTGMKRSASEMSEQTVSFDAALASETVIGWGDSSQPSRPTSLPSAQPSANSVKAVEGFLNEIGEDSPSTPTATNKLFQTYMQPLKASDEVTSLGAAAQERMDLFDHSEHFASLFEELDAEMAKQDQLTKMAEEEEQRRQLEKQTVEMERLHLEKEREEEREKMRQSLAKAEAEEEIRKRVLANQKEAMLRKLARQQSRSAPPPQSPTASPATPLQPPIAPTSTVPTFQRSVSLGVPVVHSSVSLRPPSGHHLQRASSLGSTPATSRIAQTPSPHSQLPLEVKQSSSAANTHHPTAPNIALPSSSQQVHPSPAPNSRLPLRQNSKSDLFPQSLPPIATIGTPLCAQKPRSNSASNLFSQMPISSQKETSALDVKANSSSSAETLFPGYQFDPNVIGGPVASVPPSPAPSHLNAPQPLISPPDRTTPAPSAEAQPLSLEDDFMDLDFDPDALAAQALENRKKLETRTEPSRALEQSRSFVTSAQTSPFPARAPFPRYDFPSNAAAPRIANPQNENPNSNVLIHQRWNPNRKPLSRSDNLLSTSSSSHHASNIPPPLNLPSESFAHEASTGTPLQNLQIQHLLQKEEEIVEVHSQSRIEPTAPYEAPQVPRYQRFIVNLVDKLPEEMVVKVSDENGANAHVLRLRGPTWMNMRLSIGDIVNVIGKAESGKSEYIVDDEKNFLVVHPDVLITGTQLSDFIACERRGYLSIKVKNTSVRTKVDVSSKDNKSELAVYGTILHQVLQAALEQNNFDKAVIEANIKDLLRDNVVNLYANEIDEEKAFGELKQHIEALSEWGSKYLNSADGGYLNNNTKRSVKIVKVLGVEEKITSQMFGAVGHIDVTVGVVFEDAKPSLSRSNSFTRSNSGRLLLPPPPAPTQAETQKRVILMPLEIKSGRMFWTQDTQVILYSFLLSDRYNIEVNTGLLYSLADKGMKEIVIDRVVARTIVDQRNRIASSIVEERVPPMRQIERDCERCFAKAVCFAYHKAVEDGTKETAGIGDMFTENVLHILPSHAAFMREWDGLLSLEEKETTRDGKESWALTASNRDNAKSTLRGMKIVESKVSRSGNGIYYVMKRIDQAAINLLDVKLDITDKVMLSLEGITETRHWRIGYGAVSDVRAESITVWVRRDPITLPQVMPGIEGPRSQTFTSDLTNDVLKLTDAAPNFDGLEFRIDKDEGDGSLKNQRGNIIQLAASTDADTWRRLIIDLETPRFSLLEHPFRLEQIQEMSKTRIQLNSNQTDAINKVLSAEDYALILGMPGTGKTSCVSALIAYLVHIGKSVLVTAYTHSAVDNMCVKLMELGVDFVRLSPSLDKVAAEVRHMTLTEGMHDSVAALSAFLDSKKVWATTCLGVAHKLFATRVGSKRFDYCIVDEASQLTLPACIGPLFFADRFVLVGDHYQLPPLVLSTVGREKGLGVSLFRRLSEAHPSSVVTLEYQYRMNEDIMAVSNRSVYSNRLKCGTESLRHQSLFLPIPLNLPQLLDSTMLTADWIRFVLDPDRRVVFLNTDPVPAEEYVNGDIVRNETEAALAALLVDSLAACGIKPEDIGVISPWRSQVKNIQERIRDTTGAIWKKVEVHTVDRFQGRDKEVMIVSLVRSNSQQNIGSLLSDWRRINVAFTRAKRKMLILGSVSTLQHAPSLQDVIVLCGERKWVFDLPPQAHKLYRPNPSASLVASSFSSQWQSPPSTQRAAGSRINPNGDANAMGNGHSNVVRSLEKDY